MKLKKVQSLCKAAAEYMICDNRMDLGQRVDSQWIGTRDAMYLATGLPYLTEDSLCNLWDVPQAKRDKLDMQHESWWTSVPMDVSIADTTGADETAELLGIGLIVRGETLLPITTGHGMLFLWERYLLPLMDTLATGALELCIRPAKSDGWYIIAKARTSIVGVFRPCNMGAEAVLMDKIHCLDTACAAMRHINPATGELTEM